MWRQNHIFEWNLKDYHLEVKYEEPRRTLKFAIHLRSRGTLLERQKHIFARKTQNFDSAKTATQDAMWKYKPKTDTPAREVLQKWLFECLYFTNCQYSLEKIHNNNGLLLPVDDISLGILMILML